MLSMIPPPKSYFLSGRLAKAEVTEINDALQLKESESKSRQKNCGQWKLELSQNNR